MKRGKRNILWNNKNPAVAPPVERKRAYHDDKISDETRSELEGHLFLGALFIALVDFETVKYPKRVTPPPFVELVKHNDHGAKWNPNYNKQLECFIEAGTPVIYAGTIRAEETVATGSLRVLRHTFIVKDGRYIIRNLNFVKPIGLIEPPPDSL